VWKKTTTHMLTSENIYQLAASDAEQIQVSQRQQLAALCNALEASEKERELLAGKAARAESR